MFVYYITISTYYIMIFCFFYKLSYISHNEKIIIATLEKGGDALFIVIYKSQANSNNI